MVSEFYTVLTNALERAKDLPRTRETSLVVTKIEEALFWYKASQQTEQKAS